MRTNRVQRTPRSRHCLNPDVSGAGSLIQHVRQYNAPMRKITPKILLGGWSLWIVYRLIMFCTDPIWRSGGGPMMWSGPIGMLAVPALGGWLAWRLYLRPRRSTAIWFAVLCVLLLWKFCFGDIAFRMLPAMGSHTFGGAVAAWWSLVTSSLLSAVATVFSLPLVLFSIFFWPAYCLRQQLEPDGHAEPGAPPNGGPAGSLGNSSVRGGPPSVS